MKKIVFFAFLFFFILPVFSTVHAQLNTARSNCVITDVGNPAASPVLPEHCIGGGAYELPPNLECISVPAEEPGGVPGKYCRMPENKHLYDLYGTRWGSEEMIGVLYSVALNWQRKYCTTEQTATKTCKAKLHIGDITADNHKTHFWGIAVDFTATTDGTDLAANHISERPYNACATVELGKLIVDTGYFDTIWFNGDVGRYCNQRKGDLRRVYVNNEIFAYAKSKFPHFKTNTSGNVGIRPLEGHSNHFHLNIDRTKNYSTRSSRNLNKGKLRRCTNVAQNIC